MDAEDVCDPDTLQVPRGFSLRVGSSYVRLSTVDIRIKYMKVAKITPLGQKNMSQGGNLEKIKGKNYESLGVGVMYKGRGGHQMDIKREDGLP